MVEISLKPSLHKKQLQPFTIMLLIKPLMKQSVMYSRWPN